MIKRQQRATEKQIQIAMAKFVRLQYPNKLIFHVPNGGVRPKVLIKGKLVCLEGKSLNEQGQMPGASDWICLEPSGDFHGFAIEVKSDSGTVSPEQKKFLLRAKANGYFVDVLRCPDLFATRLKSYFNNPASLYAHVVIELIILV